MDRLTFTDLTTFTGSKIWERETSTDGRPSIGAFQIKNGGSDFYLFDLDEFDANLYSGVALRKNEKLFRYETRTSRIGNFSPIIKINMKSGLVYFQTDLYSTDLDFETISEKPIWIDFNQTQKPI